MITTGFYKGQGLGNQLWCYITMRVLALDKGFDFGVTTPENFVGTQLFDLDFGDPVTDVKHELIERSLVHMLNGSDIRGFDERLRDVKDGTDLKGLFQDEQFIRHRKKEIKEWLRVRPEADCRDYSSDAICIINFRGGGYAFDVDFFLPHRYWKDAVAHMRKINPDFRFVVVTDDVKTAQKFFPEFEVNHWSPAKDFAVVKNAKYLIASNSSFAFFPAFLSDDLAYVIGPKYWGRHNISDGYWSLSCNIFDNWNYLDRTGKLSDYETCRQELDTYMKAHPELYSGNREFKKSIGQWLANNSHIFATLRRDIGTFSALAWLVHARGLRGAIWIKDAMTRISKSALAFSKGKAKKLQRKFKEFRGAVRDQALEKKARSTWLTPSQIREYRKGIRIYDVFTFFNELDLLEIRLEILGPYVDHFVLTEARQTFSGDAKPLYYGENKARFKKWEHKIIHNIVERIPTGIDEVNQRLRDPDLNAEEMRVLEYTASTPIIDPTKIYWVKEFYIKESARKALAGLRDDDFCYVSDLDEIWDPEFPIDYSKDDLFRLRLRPYMYFLNNRSNEHWRGWSGTNATKYKNIRTNSISYLCSHKNKMAYVPLNKAGWHFGYFGGAVGARRKIKESNHPFYKNDQVLPSLDTRIMANKDHRGLDTKLWVDESDLPRYIVDNKEKLKRFFK
jgi:hypothetical protein